MLLSSALDQLQTFLFDLPTPAWAVFSGLASGAGTWVIGARKVNASIEEARIRMIADTSSSENAERAAFRATLLTEITQLRILVKDCETEKEDLRERINRTEEQILVLKASNEIMERWVAFFRDRSTPEARLVMRPSSSANQRDQNTGLK